MKKNHPKTNDEKKEEKRLYDIEYRKKNLERILTNKKEYHKKTYNKEKERIKRQKRMPYHIEYCRQPKYKEWKSAYDKEYRARKTFGEYAEVFLILQDIEDEIKKRISSYEIRQENNTINKKDKRRKEDK